jgi:hypothetical protein
MGWGGVGWGGGGGGSRAAAGVNAQKQVPRYEPSRRSAVPSNPPSLSTLHAPLNPRPPPPERVSRVETETKTVRQVGADLLRLQERVEGERAARETELGQLRTEVHEVLGNRNVADEKFQVGSLGRRGGKFGFVVVRGSGAPTHQLEVFEKVACLTCGLTCGSRV